MDPDGVGDEYPIGSMDEEATFDHTDDTPDALLQLRWVDDGIEPAIKEAIAAVGDKGVTGRRVPQPYGGAQRLKRRPGWLQPEFHDRDRHWRVCAQPVNQFLTVNDDRELPAGGGDDLLPQQGPAQTFDQIQRAALHFIRTVDREIDRSMHCERGERDSLGCRLRGRSFRCRNAKKAKALAMAFGK